MNRICESANVMFKNKLLYHYHLIIKTLPCLMNDLWQYNNSNFTKALADGFLKYADEWAEPHHHEWGNFNTRRCSAKPSTPLLSKTGTTQPDVATSNHDSGGQTGGNFSDGLAQSNVALGEHLDLFTFLVLKSISPKLICLFNTTMQQITIDLFINAFQMFF